MFLILLLPNESLFHLFSLTLSFLFPSLFVFPSTIINYEMDRLPNVVLVACIKYNTEIMRIVCNRRIRTYSEMLFRNCKTSTIPLNDIEYLKCIVDFQIYWMAEAVIHFFSLVLLWYNFCYITVLSVLVETVGSLTG